MLVNIRAHLDFLDLDDLLFFAGLSSFLLGFELRAAMVHNFTDRDLTGRDFNHIQAGFVCQTSSDFDFHQANIVAIFSDQANFRGFNIFVRTGAFLDRNRISLRAGYLLSP